MPTSTEMKNAARRLREHLESRQVALPHSASLEAIAAAFGFRDWNTACAGSTKEPVLKPHMANLVVNIGTTAAMLDSSVEQLLRTGAAVAVFHIGSGTREHCELVDSAVARLRYRGVEASSVPLYSEESEAALRAGREGASTSYMRVIGQGSENEQRMPSIQTKNALEQARVIRLFSDAGVRVAEGADLETVLGEIAEQLTSPAQKR